MPTYVVDVEFVDGDDFAAETLASRVHIEADTEREAVLVAEQMIHTPMRGKPDHIQVVACLLVY